MTSSPAVVEAVSLRFRVGRRDRGQVHQTLPGETFAARCGVPVQAGELTTEAATCLTCLGQRTHRGGPARRRADAPDLPRPQLRRLLRLTDRALSQLEEANCSVFETWLSERRLSPDRAGERAAGTPPPHAYEPPPEPVRTLILSVQARYELRLRVAPLVTTLTAHDELLRLQGYLLPGGDDA